MITHKSQDLLDADVRDMRPLAHLYQRILQCIVDQSFAFGHGITALEAKLARVCVVSFFLFIVCVARFVFVYFVVLCRCRDPVLFIVCVVRFVFVCFVVLFRCHDALSHVSSKCLHALHPAFYGLYLHAMANPSTSNPETTRARETPRVHPCID